MLAVPAAPAFDATEVVARPLPKVPARLRAAAKYTCEFDAWGVARTLAYLLTGATRGWEARSHTLTAAPAAACSGRPVQRRDAA